MKKILTKGSYLFGSKNQNIPIVSYCNRLIPSLLWCFYDGLRIDIFGVILDTIRTDNSLSVIIKSLL